MKETDKEKAMRAAKKLGREYREPAVDEKLLKRLELLRQAVKLKEEQEAAEREAAFKEAAIKEAEVKEAIDREIQEQAAVERAIDEHDMFSGDNCLNGESSATRAVKVNPPEVERASAANDIEAAVGTNVSGEVKPQCATGLVTPIKRTVKVRAPYFVDEGESALPTDFIVLNKPHERKSMDALIDYPEIEQIDVQPICDAVEQCFKRFDISAMVEDCVVGLTMVSVRCRLFGKTKLSSISSIQSEIELALMSDVQISRVADESLVAVNISKHRSGSMGLKLAVNSEEYERASDMKLAVVAGFEQSGGVKFYDLTTQPHLLVAGTTGSGKSNYLHVLINSLMLRYPPEYVRFLIIDIKRVEFSIYAGDPYLLTSKPIDDIRMCETVLENLNEEMNRRYKLLAEAGKPNIASYNEIAEEKLPYIVTVIDEFATLADSVEDFDGRVRRIAAMARAAGIHLVIATQRPDVKSISGTIRANIPSRIAFRTASATDSRLILNSPDARKLTGYGDMLLSENGSQVMPRLLAPYISQRELESIIASSK